MSLNLSEWGISNLLVKYPKDIGPVVVKKCLNIQSRGGNSGLWNKCARGFILEVSNVCLCNISHSAREWERVGDRIEVFA